MNNQILFVHIPKTAGTSFRLAAQKYFGKENTYFDYNVSSTETSKPIIKYIYKDKDFYALSEEFTKYKQMFLSGHFSARKYQVLFDTTNTITFVRNPIDQVISHYKHFVTHSNYKNDLETFIQESRFKNIQSKMLSGRNLNLYGFIGITEEYDKSIEIINKYYNLNLETLNLNTALNDAKVDSRIIELIKKENQQDLILYEKARKIFYQHLACYEKNQVYTYGFIQEVTEKNIRGLAFQKDNKKPIVIEIYNVDKLLTSFKAKECRQGIATYSNTRKGFVGFNYQFDRNISNLENIKVIIKETNQEIL